MAFVLGVAPAGAGVASTGVPVTSQARPQRSIARVGRGKAGSQYTYAASHTFGARIQFASSSSAGASSAAGPSHEPLRIVCAKANTPQKFEFQAEVNRLMDLIIHSLYSNKEIFLRELISNSSDALDKVRFLGTQREGLLKDGEELKIGIRANKDERTLTISDNGIGMTRQELIDNLGTIARSGTSKFLETLKEGQGDMSLIGKFGVGFYSAYLVADRATVVTRSPEDKKQWKWESAADGTFTVEECDSPKLERGTSIVLHVKEDQTEFLEEFRLRQIIKRYSEFINFPIYLWTSQEVKKKGAEGEEEKTETVHEWELLNQNKPLWMRAPKELTDEDYKEFYKSAFKDFYEPLAWSHFSAEGAVEFRSILYLPERTGFQPEDDWLRKSHSMKLYVRRVFIADEFEDLMPRYLNFVRGLVDSEDLPLNVSREILQQSRVLRTIRSRLVRKALDMIKEVAAREGDAYDKFWRAFGRNVKLGVIEDSENQKELMEALRFFSSKSQGVTSLKDYVSRMKEGQKAIYYIAGESVAAIQKAPFLEKLLKRDLEVLYFIDPIDELMMGHVFEYAEKPFANVTKEQLELDDEAKEDEAAKKEEEESFKDVISWLETHLKDKVQKVNLTKRLEDSPAVVVTGMFGWTANMERIMKAQTMNDSSKLNGVMNQKILEINPKHTLIVRLAEAIRSEPEAQGTADLADVIHETALLISGFSLDNQADYAARVYRLLLSS